jgi:hypothetical protein
MYVHVWTVSYSNTNVIYISLIEGTTKNKSIWKQGKQKNIWTYEGEIRGMIEDQEKCGNSWYEIEVLTTVTMKITAF